MSDRVLGTAIFFASLTGAGLYFWLLFLSSWSILAIQLSVFIAVTAILVIVAWIGYTFATTPTPTSPKKVSPEEMTESKIQ